MSEANGNLPKKLAEIVDDFNLLVGREKLEHLLYFAENFPELPQGIEIIKDEDHQIHECMTPVFIESRIVDGKMRFYFDVPEESPTVRGYASLMHQGTYDVTPEQVLAIPNDFYTKMDLQGVISGQRINGLTGLLRQMKLLAAHELER
jgi:cysteine desulfuration protein SufE